MQSHEQTEGRVWIPVFQEAYDTATDANPGSVTHRAHGPSETQTSVPPTGHLLLRARHSLWDSSVRARLGAEKMGSFSRAPLASLPFPAFATTPWPGVLRSRIRRECAEPRPSCKLPLGLSSVELVVFQQTNRHPSTARRTALSVSMSSCLPVLLVYLLLSVLYPTCE